jgi:hypothetical protein
VALGQRDQLDEPRPRRVGQDGDAEPHAANWERLT